MIDVEKECVVELVLKVFKCIPILASKVDDYGNFRVSNKKFSSYIN